MKHVQAGADGSGHVAGDLIVSAGGLCWRGRHQQQYQFFNWESAGELFQGKGDLQTVER